MDNHWLKVSSLYEDLRKQRSLVDNDELGDVYTNVIELYNKSIEEENYIQSFILIQNLFEDRLYTLFKYVKEEREGYYLSLETLHQRTDLKKMVWELTKKYQIFDEKTKRTLNKSIDIRNRFIHFSFMKPNVYSKKLCDVFYILFREMDREVQNFKKS
jgi:hypothetical protein